MRSVRLLVSPFLVGLVVGLSLAYTAAPQPELQTPARRPSADGRARLEAWASIRRERALSSAETLRLVTIPDEDFPEIEGLDRRCVLYTHAEWRLVALDCLGVGTE